MPKTKKTYKKVEQPDFPKWNVLLKDACTIEGVVSDCYSLFRDYSVGNQMLAFWQCKKRDIVPGPIGTYRFWESIGRHVVSGPGSAIYLSQPVTWKKTETDASGNEASVQHTSFKYLPHWFVLSQTEGEPYELPELPGFDLGNAIVSLEIEPVEFTSTQGNCMGYAEGRTFAVNPLGKHQMATTMHEIAHIVLGHTDGQGVSDLKNRTPRSIMELEAEATALIILDQLGDKDHKESRGYIQAWYKDKEVPEENARRIFRAANQILRSGRTSYRRDDNGTTV